MFTTYSDSRLIIMNLNAIFKIFCVEPVLYSVRFKYGLFSNNRFVETSCAYFKLIMYVSYLSHSWSFNNFVGRTITINLAHICRGACRVYFWGLILCPIYCCQLLEINLIQHPKIFFTTQLRFIIARNNRLFFQNTIRTIMYQFYD